MGFKDELFNIGAVDIHVPGSEIIMFNMYRIHEFLSPVGKSHLEMTDEFYYDVFQDKILSKEKTINTEEIKGYIIKAINKYKKYRLNKNPRDPIVCPEGYTSIEKLRVSLNLTKAQCGNIIFITDIVWDQYENWKEMHPALWELFSIVTNCSEEIDYPVVNEEFKIPLDKMKEILLEIPTPETIKYIRSGLNLTKWECSEILHYRKKYWISLEQGKTRIKLSYWHLFLIKTRLISITDYIKFRDIPVVPPREELKKIRKALHLSLTEASALLYLTSKSFVRYELNNCMRPPVWLLFKLRTGLEELNIRILDENKKREILSGIDTDNIPTNNMIRDVRKRLGMKINESAVLIVTNVQNWHSWENNRCKMPRHFWKLFLIMTGLIPLEVYRKDESKEQ